MAEILVHASKKIKRESFKSWNSTTTHIKVIRHRQTWTIDNFSIRSKDKAKLESPTFLTGTNETEWRLDLYPQGDPFWHEIDITLRLVVVKYHLGKIRADYTFGIVNAEGEDVHKYSSSHHFVEKTSSSTQHKFFPSEYLFQEENKLLSDDKLTIFCEITATVGCDNVSRTFMTPQVDLAKDFAFMLENKEHCDVTLSTGDKEFPAHKFILRARSPVFRAMFQHDMVESKSNRVEIKDIDDEILGEMLSYMYTGEVHNLKQIAPRLLKISDKYQMDGLKIMCEKALLENLSYENAAETFILSEELCATEFMNEIKDFIVVHAAEVGKTSGFESMVRTHPHLAVEAFRACTK